jgi:hypothetical protein
VSFARASRAVAIGVWVAGSAAIEAQETAAKRAVAVAVTGERIRVDGRLTEAIWRLAAPVIDFVQAEPDEGAEPTDTTEVRFAFDETGLYVGARMSSRDPVQAPLSRRDEGAQAEYLLIDLDTFFDRRTSYAFGVTAAGVRLDHYHPTDEEGDRDEEYDPVWEVRTAVDAGGWTAEMWLPFAQLRFNQQAGRVWGLNIKRSIPTRNEEIYWSLVRRTERGWSSRFGELHGLDGVRPAARLEWLPYVSSAATMAASRDRANPFVDAVDLTPRAGVDVKYGLGSNLTLEATVNPDFGQVEADPAEVNLTVFETTFPERRPFFLEGNNLLEAGAGNYYYSRRIGAPPTGAASGEYVDYPSTATILGAVKLTGRLSSGTSIGILGAATAEEHARTFTRGQFASAPVAPRAGWGVARVIHELGNEGSTMGAHLTVVHRDLSPADGLASALVRNAVTAGADTRLRFKDRTYEAAFNLGITHVDGEPGAIERVQRASQHFFQRLDQPTIRLDPSRRSLSGAQFRGAIDKIAGRHWLWGYNLMIESPEFHPLDFGRLNYAGDWMGGPRLTYRETRPGRWLRAYSVSTNLGTNWYFDRDLGVRYNLNTNASATLPNFWSTSLQVNRFFGGLDAQLTRGGPAMGAARGWSSNWTLRNRAGATTRWSGTINRRWNEFGEVAWSASGSLSARPTPSLQLSVEPEYSNEGATSATFQGAVNRQYLTTLSGGRPETYGRRYVFGVVDRTTLSLQLRASYVFRPDVTLDVYTEPFAASGRYNRFGELARARARDLRFYGTDGTALDRLADGSYRVTDGDATFTLSNRDFNVRSFRSNVVLRWEWRPGSTLFAVWQQNRTSTVAEGDHVSLRDLWRSWSAPGDHIIALKTTVWLSR